MGDSLTAALEEIRERREAAECVGLWRPTQDELDLGHDDIPRLLAALRAVLELHSAWEIREGDDGEGELERMVCRHCCAADGGGQTDDCAVIHMPAECWPCDTIRVISRELKGENE